ncbi:hypothetical protein [Reichenbachiella ulvae]|uniref:Lipoprotein n=1 Tax=Reichenbachiella ulvae TaxID=2980104 RepID=A0ABT3CWQ1_9BACT|nr:hypothetical protein [Reichenbachiella ulvae]MCV9388131.1 hypothetical protein [Reichenbachiella ulvae]
MKNRSFEWLKEKVTILILLIGLCALSCENQSPLNSVSEADVPALILFEGDPAVDGCGWLIHHENTSYSPVNLHTDFQHDSLKVILSYNVLESTWNCGWREFGYDEIEISKIKRH